MAWINLIVNFFNLLGLCLSCGGALILARMNYDFETLKVVGLSGIGQAIGSDLNVEVMAWARKLRYAFEKDKEKIEAAKKSSKQGVWLLVFGFAFQLVGLA